MDLKTQPTTHCLEKGWKKMFRANKKEKQAGVATLASDKTDFKTKHAKTQHYTVIKGSS